ncbi:class I poly(R)-hydroxyalkanoic acid synthase [Teredinibacter sp. KSP-S5-2]|uniref:PHA/PHB synthase family protein n=1 Tax=Teredinibacter sp. KSP-S5-2 TaxID=3034506 RepID=UPI00293511CF|nr:class I poly(R)-hydroxyalkanoic acid synthase [Teredinibacter sp. KSP-S5-2]WNO07510.1 class I poly(R)-hydroxyalkanoic acid synthase [Teredinibacter sp. KSP-S5-2]
MTPQELAEVARYLDDFSKQFNDVLQEVTKRILKQQLGSDLLDESLSSSNNSSSSIRINPELLVQQQMRFLEKQQRLWQSASRAFMGEEFESVIDPDKSDTRFQDKDWQGNPVFNYVKQAYLINAEYMQELVASLEFEDKHVEQQVKFFTRQFINSVSPSNYAFTNPEVCREILATEGENLAKGMNNFLRDLENSPNEAFKISQVSVDAFELGRDLAATPGDVIFQNRLIQLIRYQTKVDSVYQRPLLIIPPFINKFYILDLNQKKSLVSWLLEQGYSVYMISWVNPDQTYADMPFDEYVKQGVLAALDKVCEDTGESSINTAGYCVGGTLLGLAQAYLEKISDKRIHSLTFITTLFDFCEPGEVGNFLSQSMLPVVEQSIKQKGYMDGRILALSFSLLRENNLFWAYFIDNYLKGADPVPFDILYWNGDSTNIPGKAYLEYLKDFYIANRMAGGDRVNVLGQAVSVADITLPSYHLAAVSDHIVLWTAAYKSCQLLGGRKRFVLTESGHVAGVVNPPEKGKYGHWSNAQIEEQGTVWFEHAKYHKESWWKDWGKWLSKKSGEKKDRADAMVKITDIIEPAPGTYVKVRLERF